MQNLIGKDAIKNLQQYVEDEMVPNR
jgi:hypothetical protein